VMRERDCAASTEKYFVLVAPTNPRLPAAQLYR
jgi:hypothetical protein